MLHPRAKHLGITRRQGILSILLSLLLLCQSYGVIDTFQETVTIATPMPAPRQEVTPTPAPQREERKADQAQPVKESTKIRSPRSKNMQSGKASWYGPGFHGKPTASGEVFDQALMTAAHNTLPLGSKAKVINLANGNAVEVKINDRGPFVDGRIIDLSRAAARALGILASGVTQVRVEILTLPVG
jgi:rare lipoprotein A